MAYVTNLGTALQLGGKIGEGKEKAVYSIQGSANNLAGIYLRQRTPDENAKLNAMLTMVDADLLKFTSWPNATICNSTARNTVVGFTMANMRGCRPIFSLYQMDERNEHFPEAGWRFMLHAALNMADAFAVLHKKGHIIGDVNSSNIMVAPDAMVRLIDCDSFQIAGADGIWPCEVAVMQTQPPELHNGHFNGVRTPNHDNFGLAVMIFQLLFLGKHPFGGKYYGAGDGPTSTEEAIAQYRYAFSADTTRTLTRPQFGSLPISAVPAAMQKMFEAAFSPLSMSSGRPTAQQWVVALTALLGALKMCQHGHEYFNGLTQCPFCAAQALVPFAILPSMLPAKTKKRAAATPTRPSLYDKDGYDQHGYDKDGYDRNGFADLNGGFVNMTPLPPMAPKPAAKPRKAKAAAPINPTITPTPPPIPPVAVTPTTPAGGYPLINWLKSSRGKQVSSGILASFLLIRLVGCLVSPSSAPPTKAVEAIHANVIDEYNEQGIVAVANAFATGSTVLRGKAFHASGTFRGVATPTSDGDVGILLTTEFGIVSCVTRDANFIARASAWAEGINLSFSGTILGGGRNKNNTPVVLLYAGCAVTRF